MKKSFLGLGLLLAGCGLQNTNNQVAALQATYIAAVSAEITYAQLPTHNVVLLGKIEADRQVAYAALVPLTTAAENGTSVISTAEMEAATAAITAFQNYEAINNLGAK